LGEKNTGSSNSTRLRTLYLHIPFCRRICPFCAFAVRKENPLRHQEYLSAILDEARLRKQETAQALEPLDSIYFGGGTPSRLSVAELSQLLEGLHSIFAIAPEVEIAFEVNPEDLTDAYSVALRQLGVNRVSLGGQSFNDTTLKTLGRQHTGTQLKQALTSLKTAGIRNWNLDLIFGVPGQTLEAFASDLEAALSFAPPHLSLYGLEVHEGTPFARRPEVLSWEEAHSELFASQYLHAIEQLSQSALRQYEVSNFAAPGWEGRQNLRVWDGEGYLGLGVGAHSFWARRRWGNVRSLHAYQKRLREGKAPEAFFEELSPTQLANEVLMLQLRRPSGLNLQRWAEAFSVEEGLAEGLKWLERWKASGWAREGTVGQLALTPEGLLRADAITAVLLQEEPTPAE
jgi:oxygen-independent coproporphyrinogen-3 oxidase